MSDFDIEILIAGDIRDQLEKAASADGWGLKETAEYRCAVAKGYCQNLIERLDERLKKAGKI